ncbi:ankyrin repeat domain-containing protein [Poseidonibacter sp.]|uniref:ankyrin repeat domain-containing protein n=2 Tax=Poseidonibacter sp. TaxID=2321188 RepID=UPI003C78D48A
MLSSLFKKHTFADVKKELETQKFDASKLDSMIKSVNLKQTNFNNQTLIHEMCKKNKIDAVIWLVKKGLDINAEDSSGQTPLVIAIENKNIEMIKILLRLNADVNHVNFYKRIALQECAKFGNIEIYDLLEKLTVKKENIDTHGQNIVFDAVLSKNEEMIKKILLNRSPSKIDFKQVDENNQNFLFHFIKSDIENEELIEEVILNNSDLLNHQDKNGNTVLIEAVKVLLSKKTIYSKEEEPLYYFIKSMCLAKIDETIENKKSESALFLAINSKNLEAIKLLLDAGISPNIQDKNGNTPLSTVAVKGEKFLPIVSLLIDYAANPDIKDNEEKTIIEKLIDIELFLLNEKQISPKLKKIVDKTSGNYFNVLEKILYRSEVNLKKLNSQKEPYFYEASVYGHVKLIKLLTKYGADINQSIEGGLNIIYKLMSVFKDEEDEVKLSKYYITLRTVIKMGANVNTRDDFGGITLHKAILDNDIQTVTILISLGADIEAIDNRGRNMVHNTIWKNRNKIFRLICSRNKNLLNMTDKFNVLPIHYAAFLGYTDLVLELMHLGAHINSTLVKAPYIIKFLERFNKNLSTLVNQTKNPTDRKKVSDLVTHMRKEFEVKE